MLACLDEITDTGFLNQFMQATSPELSRAQCYFKLAALVLIAGNIYPIIYLRQSYEVSIIETFGISVTQLNDYYAWLGGIYLITYLPSGWLSDRIAPRALMSFSLLATGLLGVWFASVPSPESLKWIFIGWGVTAGLTFWSALIKATALLASPDEQGRFFGILEGGRGLVEAVLATIAAAMFAYFVNSAAQSTSVALIKVIWMYVGMMLLLAPLAYFILDDADNHEQLEDDVSGDKPGSIESLVMVLSKLEIWLCALCILCGYQLFFATYSFSGFMQTEFGLTAVMTSSIGAVMFWMRPLGAAIAGFSGDLIDRERVLAGLMIGGSIVLAVLAVVPISISVLLLSSIVVMIGFMVYAVRGIFWATLESCEVPNSVKGLAIGVISTIGYAPALYLPALNNYLLEAYSVKQSYVIYYLVIAVMGLLGAFSALLLRRIVKTKQA